MSTHNTFFFENFRKLSFNYHQIPSLSVSLPTVIQSNRLQSAPNNHYRMHTVDTGNDGLSVNCQEDFSQRKRSLQNLVTNGKQWLSDSLAVPRKRHLRPYKPF